MKLPVASQWIKVAVAFALFACGYYFPLFRLADPARPPVPAASSAAASSSPTR